MKLAGYGKEIYISLSQQFGEGIVVSVIRQLNQIHFSLPNTGIVQESLAQIRWYHSLSTVKEWGKKKVNCWEKLSGEMYNEPQG